MQKAESNNNNIKDKILENSWQLFLSKGYHNTTIDDILTACEISRGGFYHYFQAKDDLLVYLPILFDEQYKMLSKKINPKLPYLEQLFFYTQHLFEYIEDNIPMEILSIVLSAQVKKNGIKFLLDDSREYFRILRNIFTNARKTGEFPDNTTVREYIKLYALQERAVLYDWCLSDGQYPLSNYGVSIFKHFIYGIVSVRESL